ncbi:MAG: hypothetical protein NDI81_16505 [Desulfobacula sp.]|nr:hypothetical protein [Desulfobacula sp.]
MKITGSGMAFMSNNRTEEMGLVLEEKNERALRQTRPRLQDTRGLVLVDRVSISQDSSLSYQSQYSFTMTGRSSVTSEAGGEAVSHEQQTSMERLVGGVMDRTVIIKNIREKKDVPLADDHISLPESSGSLNTGGEIRSAETWEMSVSRTEIHFEEESVNFQSSGEVTTEDGRLIRFSLDLSLDRAFVSRTEEETLVQRWQERINLTDPLVISLDGRAPTLTDTSFEFDLDSDGKAEKIGFVSSGSGFLAFDKNGDHTINNGSELFGPGTGNGFLELSAFDQDHNNWIDENDSVFSRLSVWTRDENGQARLVSLKDAGIGAVSLQSAATGFDLTRADNRLQGRLKNTGVFLFENGKAGFIQEMDLASQAEEQTDTPKADVFQNGRLISISPELPVFTPFPFTAPVSQPEEVQNPLKDLLDRIKKLKEEMGRLYESMNPDSSLKKSGRFGYGGHGALNRYPSFFPGDPKGRGPSQSRRV